MSYYTMMFVWWEEPAFSFKFYRVDSHCSQNLHKCTIKPFLEKGLRFECMMSLIHIKTAESSSTFIWEWHFLVLWWM